MSTSDLSGSASGPSKEEMQQTIDSLQANNSALKTTLARAKEEIDAIREEVKKLKAPPLPYGTLIRPSENPELIVVAIDGRLMEVNVAAEDVKINDLKPGQRLLLNPSFNVIELREPMPTGEIGKIIDVLEDGRLIVKSSETEDQVMVPSFDLSRLKLRIGDNVRYDRTSMIAFERMPKSEVEDIVLEEVPDVSYDDIGGLDVQIEQIKDAIELPYIYGHLYKEYKLSPPKGILLYGPPGCGKTLVAKAVANSLSRRVFSTLNTVKKALEIMLELAKKPDFAYSDYAERYEALRNEIYEYQAIYRYPEPDDIEAMYEKLEKSGILGNFIRRTEGDKETPRLVANISEFYDLLIELKEKGYGMLRDKKRIGEMLERKRRNYLDKRTQVSDEEYMVNWLADYLENNGIMPNSDLETELVRIEEKMGGGVESYFLNIKGPELLNKYVGETEHKIREVFIKAREKAQHGLPVIVFFDEMESIFRTRGSGISSDIESTIVPQFLAEIDGVEKLDNVITIGASNRQDLIDPAVLRPGRLDVKIRIDRPNRDAAQDIFTKYLAEELPLHPDILKGHENTEEAIDALISAAVEEMYAQKPENQFLRVTYRNREQEVLYFKDFSSGAMIEGICSRAKTYAIKRTILTGERGLKLEDIVSAIRDEYKENEDLPNTTNPDDWAKISGKKGERIISIETLIHNEEPKRREVDEKDEVSVSSRYL